MKILTIGSCLLTVVTFAVGGCMCHSHPLCYSVSFKNTGTQKIVVKDIVLYESKNFSKAGCGILSPGISAGCGKYYEEPANQYDIEWTNSDIKELTRVKVEVNLPELFYNRKNGADIIFHINPDKKQVAVAYKVFSPEKDDFIVVNSKGSPVDRENSKGDWDVFNAIPAPLPAPDEKK